MTLEAKIQGHIGELFYDDSKLSSFLITSFKDVVNAIKNINPFLLEKFSMEIASSTDDLGISTSLAMFIFDVDRNGKTSVLVPSSLRTELEPNNLLSPTAQYPKHYIFNQKVFIKPAPTSSQIGTVYGVKIPSTINVGLETIPECHDEYLNMVILKASILALLQSLALKEFNDILKKATPPVITGFSFVSTTPPVFTAPTDELVLPTLVLPPAPIIDDLVKVNSDIDFTELDASKPNPFTMPASIPLPQLELNDDFSIEPLDISSIEIPEIPPVPVLTDVKVVLPSTVPSYSSVTIDTSADVAIATTLISEDDIEVAQAQLSKIATNINSIQAEIANNLNSFNKEVKEYDAEVQKAILDAKESSTKEGLRFSLELENHREALQSYQIQISTAVTEWQAIEVQGKTVEYTTKQTGALQKFQVDSSNILQDNAAQLNKEVQRYNSELKVYEALLRKTLESHNSMAGVNVQEYSAETQSILQQYSTDVQSKIQAFSALSSSLISEYQQKLSLSIQEFQSLSTKYSLDLQTITQENANIIQKYNSDIGLFNSQIQEAVQEFNTSLQSKQVNYTWLENQIKHLEMQYNECLGALRPAEQPQVNQKGN